MSLSNSSKSVQGEKTEERPTPVVANSDESDGNLTIPDGVEIDILRSETNGVIKLDFTINNNAMSVCSQTMCIAVLEEEVGGVFVEVEGSESNVSQVEGMNSIEVSKEDMSTDTEYRLKIKALNSELAVVGDFVSEPFVI
ncbi:MAG: hypothetical protein ACE5DX_04585 [Candidatus Dojkabacteria bacterium]